MAEVIATYYQGVWTRVIIEQSSEVMSPSSHQRHHQALGALPADAACELDVFRHNGDALGVDSAQ